MAKGGSKKVKVALVGAGGMANGVHYPSVTSFEDVQIVGLCDLDQEKLKATAEKFRIKETFTNYQAMLEQTKPDAVYVLMPPQHLFDVAMDVMERGHHLFIEKPPAVTTHQAIALARKAKERKVITAVGWQRRFHPLTNTVWQKVRKAGELNQVVVSFYKNAVPSQTHPYYRGAIDILHCDAIHAVDSLRYYAGLADVVSISSNVRKLDAWYPCVFTAVVQFSNGVEGVLLTNWRSGRRIFKFEFHGANGMGLVDIDGQGAFYTDNKVEPAWQSDHVAEAGSDQTHIHQGFCQESRAFIDAVKKGKPPHHSLEDAYKSMDLVDKIYGASMMREETHV